MTPRERELLVEAAATAHREIDRDGRLLPPPAWADLPPDAREELFRLQLATRTIEKALTGASGTVRAVMSRISRV